MSLPMVRCCHQPMGTNRCHQMSAWLFGLPTAVVQRRELRRHCIRHRGSRSFYITVKVDTLPGYELELISTAARVPSVQKPDLPTQSCRHVQILRKQIG